MRYNRFEGAVGVQGEAGAVGLRPLGSRAFLTGRQAPSACAGSRWDAAWLQFGAPTRPGCSARSLRAELALQRDDQDTLYSRTCWGGRLAHAMSERRRIAAGYTRSEWSNARRGAERRPLRITEPSLDATGATTVSAPAAAASPG